MSPQDTEAASPDEPSPLDEARATAGRRRLRLVALILFVEAAGLAAFAGYLVVNLAAGSEETTKTSNTVIETIAFFALAAILALLGRGCGRARRWARAPMLVTQLIALLGVGWPLLQGDMWYRLVLGVPVSAAAAAAIVIALTPTATAAFELDD